LGNVSYCTYVVIGSEDRL